VFIIIIPKLGNSNLEEQTLALKQVLPLLKKYKFLVLRDSEFCSGDAGILAQDNGCIFLLENEKNPCLETENLIWQRLDQLAIIPITSLYFQGVIPL
jgi:hypothetical protein